MTIKVKYWDRLLVDFEEKEISPTLKAVAELVDSPVEHLTIRAHGINQLYIESPYDRGVVVSHENFKKML